jgi:hypothetical protein
VPVHVTEAYDDFMDQPGNASYLRFLHANRAAAREHPFRDDERGVMHQLLAIEAQSLHAEMQHDLHLADSVVRAVDEFEQGGVMLVYDEVVPGARERFLAARARVAGMLE